MNRQAAILSIGNELLLGRTINTNLGFLASQMSKLGLPILENIVIRDERSQILDTITKLWQSYAIVICTGGLGPTADDITKATIAEYFGKELIFREDIWQEVQARFSRRGMKTPAINRCQAQVPEGFTALENKQGTAPGLLYQEEGKVFIALPGVPHEMKHLWETHLKVYLQKHYDCQPIYQRDVHTFEISESALAERLGDFTVPEEVSLAWLPQTGRVDLRLYGTDKNLVDGVLQKMLPLIEDVVWAFDYQTPYSVLHELMLEKGLSLSVAESCTGGLIQKNITELPGASEYFMGGMVTYSNLMKENVLKVSLQILMEHGAVSTQCAQAMAAQIKLLTNSKIGISVTGIAGPDGGCTEKPVGTVFFGIATEQSTTSFRQMIPGDRTTIRHRAADFLVLKLIKLIRGEKV